MTYLPHQALMACFSLTRNILKKKIIIIIIIILNQKKTANLTTQAPKSVEILSQGTMWSPFILVNVCWYDG